MAEMAQYVVFVESAEDISKIENNVFVLHDGESFPSFFLANEVYHICVVITMILVNVIRYKVTAIIDILGESCLHE